MNDNKCFKEVESKKLTTLQAAIKMVGFILTFLFFLQ